MAASLMDERQDPATPHRGISFPVWSIISRCGISKHTVGYHHVLLLNQMTIPTWEHTHGKAPLPSPGGQAPLEKPTQLKNLCVANSSKYCFSPTGEGVLFEPCLKSGGWPELRSTLHSAEFKDSNSTLQRISYSMLSD